MKKSLQCMAVLAALAGSAAQAATVYDKDDTVLAVGGRVQAVVYNGNYHMVGQDDTGLVNSARLNLYGKSKINDYVSVFAFTEWNMADGNKSATGDSINTRDQYIGADFGKYGQLTLGKQYDALYSVQGVTDVFEYVGVTAQSDTCADRRTGQIKYTYDNYGVWLQAALMTSQDSVQVNGSKSFTSNGVDGSVDVKTGYSASLGYTFDDVVFGPLAIKAGYSYLRGKDNTDGTTPYMKTFKNKAASISWGDLSSGLYLAAMYTDARFKSEFLNVNDEKKVKGPEIIGGYAFDNGISFLTGYEVADISYANSGSKKIQRRIPLYVNYQLNSNFKVWAEAEFDAGSSDSAKKDKSVVTDTLFNVGGRYTF